MSPQSAIYDAIRERVAHIPIMETMGYVIESLRPGECHLRMPYQKTWNGIYESLHGGLLMTLSDTAACFAIMTLTGHEQVMTTTDMNIRFLGPCLGDAIAVAKVIKQGRTLCPVQVEIFDSNSKLVAVSQVTYMLLDKLPSR